MHWTTTAMLVLSAAPAVAQPAPDPANGLALSDQLCRNCHLVRPQQPGPVPDGVPSFMAIAGMPNMDSTRIQAALTMSPHPAMPNPPLSTRQTQDVAAYILTLKP